MKLALAIIVKDELSLVKEILSKNACYFDEVAIAVDNNIEEFNKLCEIYSNLRVHSYTWIKDFSHKRNFLASKIESEYYFRMDTDDIIINPHNINKIFERVVSEKIDVVYLKYDYSRDIDGNNNANHWRETIIRRTPDIYWKKAIHENLYIEDQSKYKGVKDDKVEIFHNITNEHAEESRARNWEYLKEEFRRDGVNTDPRTIAYIGRMLIGMKKYKEAIKFLQLLIQKSGWDDDKYFAWINLAQCYRWEGNLQDSIASCNEAIAINTEFPDAYLQLGEIYIDKQDYKKAVHWIEIGMSKPVPDTMFVLDGSVYTVRCKVNLSIAYFGLGDYIKADKLMSEAIVLAPNNDFIKANKDNFKEAAKNTEFIQHLSYLVNYIRDNEKGLLSNLIKSIPKKMFRDERIAALRNMYGESNKWPDNSVAIFCGPAWETWAAPSVLTGIGGSEEAVVYLSKELNKLGYKVTVFCSCGDMAGEYEGVTYREFFEFNNNDKYDILIGWRNNIFKDKLNARKKIVWLHDVPSEEMFDVNDSLDHVVVLSEYHKSLLKNVSEDKILISSNGINLKDFNVISERNPYRMIYTSSYDRGLQHLLLLWPDIKKEVPEAELHIFYGWNTYDAMVEKGVRSVDFKQAMIKMMNQEGIFEHGRVGHKQLAKEFAKSGIYSYPSHFEEISCISAMKAQASGCVPVVFNFAALRETVKDGVIIDGKGGINNTEYKEALVALLKDVKRQENIRAKLISNKEQFGWEKVAKQWAEKLFA